jgi:hypothetical protein
MTPRTPTPFDGLIAGLLTIAIALGVGVVLAQAAKTSPRDENPPCTVSDRCNT